MAATRRRASDAVFVLGVVGAFSCILIVVLALADTGRRSVAPSPATAATSEPMAQAEDWVAANVGEDGRAIVEEAAVDDLTGRGIGAARIVAVAPTANLDDDVNGWADGDVVVISPSMRTQFRRYSGASAAIEGWRLVASFGPPGEEVEIRIVASGGPGRLHDEQVDAEAMRLRAGGDLAENPDISASTDALEALRAGAVDERVLSVLAIASAQHELGIAGFPTVAAEEDVGAPRRVVAIDRIDGAPVAAGNPGFASLEAFLDSQRGPYRPTGVEIDHDPAGAVTLRVTFAVGDTVR